MSAMAPAQQPAADAAAAPAASQAPAPARDPRSTRTARPAGPQREVLLVELVVNGQRLPGAARIERADDGALLLAKSAWIDARLVLPGAQRTMSDGSEAYALKSVAGLIFQIDRSAMTMELLVPPAAFIASTLGTHATAAVTPTRPDPGVMLNYDVAAARSGSRAALTGGAFVEAIAFSRLGSFVASGLYTADATGRRFDRLDTYWRYDMPQWLQTLVVGDTIGTAGAWSRPVRYGGVRWGRDFGMQPGFVTLPQLTLSGQAALPSTVDVMVNNARRSSQSVVPGPFEVTNIPVVNGAGDVNLVVRDVLGRETVVQQSYYASPRLLAPGLVDFSVEAGRLRTGYGRDSRYGDAFASGTVRTGLTSWLTGEARAEQQARRRAAGAELAGLLGTWAVARAALAASSDSLQGFAERGHMVQAGIERSTPQASGSLQYEYATRGFAPLGDAVGPGVAAQRTRERWVAGVGGQLGGGYAGGVNLLRQTRWDGDKLTSLGVTVSTQLRGEGNISVSLNKRLDADRSWLLAINYTVMLGSGAFSSSRIQRGADGRLAGGVTASMNPPPGPGMGWRVDASTEAGQRARGGLQLNTNWAEFTAEASADARGEVALRGGARGTLGLLGGMPFASRPVGQSGVALVEVEGLEGVPVHRSNQLVATTNSRGLAFIPGLLPWQLNKLEIDPADLPMDVEMAETVRQVVPFARSGAVVKFPMRRSRQAVVVLRQPNGQPVPEGAMVTLETGEEFVVGRRGEVWLTGMAQGRQKLAVRWAAGACRLVLELPAAQDAMPAKLGPLVCEAGPP